MLAYKCVQMTSIILYSILSVVETVEIECQLMFGMSMVGCLERIDVGTFVVYLTASLC